MKNGFLFLCLCLYLLPHPKAQTGLTGQVVDEHGEPMIGFTMWAKGITESGMVVGLDGQYRIVVADTDAFLWPACDWAFTFPFRTGNARRIDLIHILWYTQFSDLLYQPSRRVLQKYRGETGGYLTVKGQLLDPAGAPLPNTRLEVQGMDLHYTTDAEGKYNFPVPLGVMGVLFRHDATPPVTVEYFFVGKDGRPAPVSKSMLRYWQVGKE